MRTTKKTVLRAANSSNIRAYKAKSIKRRWWQRLNPPVVALVLFALALGILGATKLHPTSSAAVLSEFNVQCQADHYLTDDPLVFPGQPGASHMHTFFGNKTTNAYSTPATIAAGASSCDYISDFDRSAYWVPSLMVTDSTGTTSRYTGDSNNVAYYRRPGESSGPKIYPFPAGFSMIAGNSKATSDQSINIVQWDCGEGGAEYPHMITCPGGASAQLHASLVFPNCWDGIHLDSADHKSHMAYHLSDNTCPADHPVPLPEITYETDFPYATGGSNYNLSSGGIYSWHGDFVNGWNQSLLNGLIANCDNTPNQCHTIQVWPDNSVSTSSISFNLSNYTNSPTATLTASPASVSSGQSATLSWNTTNASSCVAIAPAGFTISGNSGSVNVSPTTTTNYIIGCSGSSGSTTAGVTVTVGGTSTPPPTTNPAPTATLTATNSTITAGQSTTLNWTSTNATGCSGTAPAGFSVSGPSGAITVTPSATTTYTISCSGAGGTTSASAIVTVNAPTPPPGTAPTVKFSASPTLIKSGQTSTLTWSTTGASSCTASAPAGFTITGTSGSKTVTPTSTTTYTISCANSYGATNASVTVSVRHHHWWHF